MRLTKEKLSTGISMMIFIVLAIQVTQTISAFTDVPPPPTRPQQFRSREELKRYLQLVHEYYAIIGRPRFGRSMVERSYHPHDQQFFHLFDMNGDQSITYDEFHHRLENE